MADDVTGSVVLELPAGSVRLRGEPVVLLPARVLESLLSAAPAPSRAEAGRELGYATGRTLAARLGGADGVRNASMENVVTELATEVALLGLGLVHFERWGRALVIGLTGGPLAGQTELLAGLLGGALSGATGAQASALSLGGERYLIGSPRTCERMRGFLSGGMAWGDALVRLQTGGAS